MAISHQRKCVARILLTLVATALLAAPAMAKQPSSLKTVQACTKHLPRVERMYNIPSHWLSAIASTESGRYHPKLKLSVPWPWTINVKGKGYWFKTKREAVAAVKHYQSKGINSIDVGCMQVNLHYHGHHFSNVSQAFEPVYNIGYAAKFLREHYDNYKNWRKATAAYHSKTPSRGSKYYSIVYKRWQQVVDRVNSTVFNVAAVSRDDDFEFKFSSPPSGEGNARKLGQKETKPRVIKVAKTSPTTAQPSQMRIAKAKGYASAADISHSYKKKLIEDHKAASAPVSKQAQNKTASSVRTKENGVLVIRVQKTATELAAASNPIAMRAAESIPTISKAPNISVASAKQTSSRSGGQFSPGSHNIKLSKPYSNNRVTKPKVKNTQFIF